jgi:hypothetical protein
MNNDEKSADVINYLRIIAENTSRIIENQYRISQNSIHKSDLTVPYSSGVDIKEFIPGLKGE